MTRHELTVAIKKKALDLGFSEVGVTTAKPLHEAADLFEHWVRSGSHGTMQWLERNHDKRRDPSVIFPEAKSILSLGLNYYTPHKHALTDESRISRYAWGTDYHEILPKMLEKLLREIELLDPSAKGRYYSDTGPLLEKAIASRAGLGWIGKHTNIITREHGSWIFLAEILLSLDLVPDLEATDMCGTCTRCIEACPTDALVAPYQLDATKCISYLTIELKPEQEVAPELAERMSGWLYGCDICQEVCPWNRFEQPSDIGPFSPRSENLSMSYEEIEQMTQSEFSNRFRKSPVKRTKLAGLKRNVRALRKALSKS